MLDNFIFSINIVLPIFAILFIGFVFRQKNFVGKEFFTYGNKIVFQVALPVNLFLSVYQADIGELLDLKFVLFAILATIASFLLIWAVSEFVLKDKPLIGTFVQGSFRGNFAVLGLPLLTNVLGAENSAKGVLVLSFVVPFYNILAIIVLTARSKNKTPVSVKSMLLSIVRNPLIIGIACGFLLSAVKLVLPVPVMQTLGYLNTLSTPLALLCLGGSMKFGSFDHKFRYALGASITKVILLPLVFVPVAYLMGFRSYDLVILMMMFSVPTAVSSHPMALLMGGDGYISATVVVLSTFFSVFSLTIFIYVFRVLGFI